jgi:hypothetical protein
MHRICWILCDITEMVSFVASNKPLEWTGHHPLSAKPPHTSRLPLRGSVGQISRLVSARPLLSHQRPVNWTEAATASSL